MTDCPNCAAMREALKKIITHPATSIYAKCTAEEVISGDAGRDLMERIKELEYENQALKKECELLGKYANAIKRGEHGTDDFEK